MQASGPDLPGVGGKARQARTADWTPVITSLTLIGSLFSSSFYVYLRCIYSTDLFLLLMFILYKYLSFLFTYPFYVFVNFISLLAGPFQNRKQLMRQIQKQGRKIDCDGWTREALRPRATGA